MAAPATFDPTMSTNVSRNRARQLLGDTGEDGTEENPYVWLLQDVTIDALIAAMTFSEAVAELATGLATRFAQQPDWYDDEGGIRMRWTDRTKAWRLLATDMRSGTQRDEIVATGDVYTSEHMPHVRDQRRPRVGDYRERPGFRF